MKQTIHRWKVDRLKLISSSLLLVLSILNNQSFSQVVNDSCHTATEIFVNPYGEFICLNGSTKEATPDELPIYPCTISGFPTVWYKMTLENYTTHINLHVSTDITHTAVVRVFSTASGCNSLVSVPIGPNEETCLSGINGQLKLIGLETDWYTTFFIAVSILHAAGADFELCINSMLQEGSCVREKEIVYYNLSSFDRFKGPFHPGDKVQVCMNVPAFTSNNNGCQWFQGLVPVFGSGWDEESFDGRRQPMYSNMNGYDIGHINNGLYGSATWDWFTDVGYHSFHPFYQVGDMDGNGYEEMCSTLFDPYCIEFGGIQGGCCSPCWDDQGDELPPGWFAYGNDGSCSTNGPPVGVDWGDGENCNSIMGPWEFCFQLKVEDFPYCYLYGNSLDLSLSFYTFSDGEIGSWTGGATVCLYDPPAQLRLPALCFVDTKPADTIDIVVCGNDTVILHLLDFTDKDPLINFWHYQNETINSLDDAAYLLPNDTLSFIVSPGSDTSISEKHLKIYGHSGEQTVCEILNFRILINPKIDAGFSFEMNELEVQFSSDMNVDSAYYWSFGDGTTSEAGDPLHVYEEYGSYQVALILVTPCGTDTFFQDVNLITSPPLVSFSFSPHHICVGDTVYFESDVIGHIDSILWTFEGGMPNHINTDTAIIFYGLAGLYDVMLTAMNVFGADTLLLSDAIQVDSAPELTYHVEVYDSLLVFTYTGSKVDSVYWDLGDGLIAYGITSTKIYEGAGEYPVILYVKGVCGLDSIPFSVKIQTTSVVTSNLGTGFSLYPNPASGKVHIKRLEDIGDTTVEIYNIVGQQVTRINWPSEQLIIPIDLERHGINPGTFYIIVKTGKGCFMAPLIVQ